MASGMTASRLLDMASTMPVPERMPVKIPAAKISPGTQYAAGMRGDAVFLLLQAWVVDDHRDTERHHEQHGQRQQAGDQRAHQRQGQ